MLSSLLKGTIILLLTILAQNIALSPCLLLVDHFHEVLYLLPNHQLIYSCHKKLLLRIQFSWTISSEWYWCLLKGSGLVSLFLNILYLFCFIHNTRFNCFLYGQSTFLITLLIFLKSLIFLKPVFILPVFAIVF